VILTTPLALLGLLAIPAIVAIHLFRRRFPVHRIAGLFLWQAVAPVPQAGGRLSRLPITASLLLECLGALALTLLAAGARCSPSGTVDHLVVLLDDSVSMSAAGPGGSTRERAVQRALQEIDRLGGRGRVTIVLSSERPAVIAGPQARPLEATRALDGWRPRASHHSLGPGLRLARELAAEAGRVLVLTDAPPADVAAADGLLWVAVGERQNNVAITAAHRTLAPVQDSATVSLTLANHADRAARHRLTVSAGGKDVITRDLEVPPGLSSVTLPLPPGLPPVRVALSEDALVLDNAVTLAEPRPRIVSVDDRLPEGRGREALERALDAIAGVTRGESPHLAFVDASEAAPSTAGAWRVAFGSGLAASVATAVDSDFAGPFVLEKRHPLLQGVTLDGVVWTGAARQPAESLRPIASAGDRALISVSGGGSPEIRLNLDLERTNLIRAPDWPILISNIVEARRQDLPGPERWNYRAGEWVRIRLGREPRGTLRFRCGEIDRELPPGRQIEFIAPTPGGLLQVLEDDAVLYELGVNLLDEHEANLLDRRSADLGRLVAGAGLRAETGAAEDPLFWVLIAVVIAAFLANWALLSPRTARRSPGDARVVRS
jgi:hypothetical protein